MPIAADHDGDGDQDLLIGSSAAGNPLHVFRNNGDATFTLASQFITGVWWMITNLAAADFDQDNDIDLVITQDANPPFARILVNDGTGTFSTGSVLNATFWDDPMLYSGDFNFDGYPDVVFLHHGFQSDTMGIMLNDGSGTLAAPVMTNLSPGFTGEPRFADLDGDGYPDIILPLGSAFGVFFNDGAGAFSAPVTYSLWCSVSLDSGDLNTDGFLDLAVRVACDSGIPGNWVSTLELFLNDGSGALTHVAGPQNGLGGGPTDGRSLAVTDVNGDLIPDLVINGDNNALAVAPFLNDGSANFTLVEPSFAPGGLYAVRFLLPGDFDADGTSDLVACQNATPHMSVVWGTSTPPNQTDCNANGASDGCEIADGL